MPVSENTAPSVSSNLQIRSDRREFFSLHGRQAGPYVSSPLKPGDAIPIPRGRQSAFRLERGAHSLRSAETRDPEAKKAEFDRAAKGFEAIFIRQLLKTMRSSVPGSSMYGNGVSGDIYGDVVENALADAMAERSSIGIADMLRREMTKRLDTGKKSDRSPNPAPVSNQTPADYSP